MKRFLAIAAVLAAVLWLAPSAEAQYRSRATFSQSFRSGLGFGLGARVSGFGFAPVPFFAPQPLFLRSRSSAFFVQESPVFIQRSRTFFVEQPPVVVAPAPAPAAVEFVPAPQQRRIIIIDQ